MMIGVLLKWLTNPKCGLWVFYEKFSKLKNLFDWNSGFVQENGGWQPLDPREVNNNLRG
jgi:hypothetical protein